jgi:hypothetical protein
MALTGRRPAEIFFSAKFSLPRKKSSRAPFRNAHYLLPRMNIANEVFVARPRWLGESVLCSFVVTSGQHSRGRTCFTLNHLHVSVLFLCAESAKYMRYCWIRLPTEPMRSEWFPLLYLAPSAKSMRMIEYCWRLRETEYNAEGSQNRSR